MAEPHGPPTPDRDEVHLHKKPRLQDDIKTAASVAGPSDVPMDEPIVDENIAESSSTPQQSNGKGPKPRGKNKRRKKDKVPAIEPYSTEDVILHDVQALLGEDVVLKAQEAGEDLKAPFEKQQVVELVVSALSSNGESLSIAPAPHPPWVILTPFALPGEKIRVKIYRNARLWSYADLVEVVEPNKELRDMDRVQCKYFGKCAGCQFQMLSYDAQLDLKRTVVVKAYQNFSGLPESTVPSIQPTIGSPLQYGYRTKITPHFDSPLRDLKKHGRPEDGSKPDWFKIGFNVIGTRHTMDIEECPIATPTLNKALGPIREGIVNKMDTYKKGVSLLLRESLEIPADGSPNPLPPPADTSVDSLTSDVEKKLCVTDHRGTIRERVGDKLFEYTAGSFFQNNNSVLVPLTSYVRDCIFPTTPSSSSSTSLPRPTHLVDAYCGSGLFAITLSPHFERVTGIELSVDSIKSANISAQLNALSPDRHTFMSGDASDIFATVTSFPRLETAVIIDPPRKGSDEKFIDQLIEFGAGVMVYVSCNVHTQARDIGMILRKSKAKRESGGGKEYVLESVRGFDLFPQTAHVESVAVLRLVDVDA
ncbi:tRNA(m5U54)methyltransferase [Steccherinum ochraceum]|uniref:tRNA(M5U54)methyltransferase n=1 Tax=Steccherinum ochraceum TaxID=92696 RepID=A0A4R0RWV2_9APHY|nr:tRNA(m5U54)methyltransferase [Steccherinum ochraceum]